MLSGGLHGRAMGALTPGMHVRAAIRPEDLALGTGPLAGRVENVEYGGRDSLVDVLLADGTRLHVRSARAAHLGEHVGVAFAPHRLLVYPAE